LRDPGDEYHRISRWAPWRFSNRLRGTLGYTSAECLLRNMAKKLAALILLLTSVVVSAQQAPEAVGTTLKTSARLAVVDVVVTDQNGQPVPGLRQEDFKILEDGKLQTISVFEEHTGAAPAAIKPRILPPNTFDNFPRADAPDSLNVVLLDGLNTPIGDQSLVHQQVLKYLAGMHANAPMAIFILSTRLRLVHGFTSDLSALLAVLNDKKSGSGPQALPSLLSGGDIHAEEQATAQLQSQAALDPNLQASLDALRQFQAEEALSKTLNRVSTTLLEMQHLAKYLAGFPGRKNVIWFSGAFPLTLFKDFTSMGEGLGYNDELRKTADAFTAARVAVYPVEAGELAPNTLYQASALPQKVTGEYSATQAQVTQLQNDSIQRNGNQATMEELAHDTGGKAFYNTNGLDEAMAQAIRDGSRYYTLDYSPTNKAMDGKYRHIHVKLMHGHYKLSYRLGYNAEDQRAESAVAEKRATADPLLPLMAWGLPDFAQILFRMSVKPSAPQPEPTAPRVGDNLKMQGAFTRMDVDLAVSEKSLQLEAAPDGRRNGTLEVTFIAYDRYGNPLNWLVRKMELSLSPEQFQGSADVGLQFHFELDAPRGASYLRTGVCDLASGRAGTIEVLLEATVARVQ
jgi:VWFA-related protein